MSQELISYFQSLPESTLLEEIFPKLSLNDMLKLCPLNSKFNKICISERLWQIKVQNEYPYFYLQKPQDVSWLEYYRYLFNTRLVPVYYHGRKIMYARIGNNNIYGSLSIKNFNEKFKQYIGLIQKEDYQTYIHILYLGKNFDVLLDYMFNRDDPEENYYYNQPFFIPKTNISTLGIMSFDKYLYRKKEPYYGKLLPSINIDHTNINYGDIKKIVIYPFDEVMNSLVHEEMVPKFSYDDIWGGFDENDNFQIVDGGYGKASLNYDPNKLILGRNCVDFTISQLIEILWHLKIPPISSDENISDEELRNFLKRYLGVKGMSREQLLFYYQWMNSGFTKEILCSIIFEYLKDKGHIMYI